MDRRPVDRYYLPDHGFPFFAIVSAVEAAGLFDSASEDRRTGDLARGFEYWFTVQNGLGRLFEVRSRVLPIPPEQLPELCRQLSTLITLPEGLSPCP
jgi:hypothetical protein